MEDFFEPGVPWPATVDSILPYLVFLVEAGKGTTVAPSVVASCNWLLKRLQLPVLASRHPVVQALQERAVEQLGLDLRALREAVELPMALVREMELALIAWKSIHHTRALMVWWYLVCLYGSMRFDDQMQISAIKLANACWLPRGCGMANEV